MDDQQIKIWEHFQKLSAKNHYLSLALRNGMMLASFAYKKGKTKEALKALDSMIMASEINHSSTLVNRIKKDFVESPEMLNESLFAHIEYSVLFLE